MQDDKMVEYRRKLREFFYPFLGNIELGNVSAAESIKYLVDAFINFNTVGYFNQPTLALNARNDGKISPPEGKPEAVGGTGLQATIPQTESTEYFSRKQGEYLIKQLETISRQQRELSEQISYLKNALAVKSMSTKAGS